MAARKPTNSEENLVINVAEKEPEYSGPRVTVFLPLLDDDGSFKVDQYEHVTIANEEKETLYRVKRGIRTDVPVPVFVVLKERYPDL